MLTGMNILIIGLALIAALVVFAYKEARKHGTRTHEEFVGICTSAYDQTLKKQSNLDKVLELLRERGELTNAQLREVLGVSSRTAVRYMDTLEEQGMVEQVGLVGHATTYRLK
jgi:predicted HTH transcriptional regulator